MLPNLRHALRSLAQAPGFTDIVPLPLALGIAVSFFGLSGSAKAQAAGGNQSPASAVREPMPPVGIVDVYGARRVPEEKLREALRIKEGSDLTLKPGEMEQRVATIPGVLQVQLHSVCCDEGKPILYVGIEEAGADRIQFNPAPTGRVRLTDEIVQAGHASDRALMEAVRNGDTEEDVSQGHSLAKNPAARARQERFLQFAARDSSLLREVLRSSSDAEHRTRAAEIIAYAADKQSVVSDLTDAARDPAPDVRNEAVRALALIAGYAQRHPDARLQVPWKPFIDLLHSIVWTDRNKSSYALMQLTESRDRSLLDELKAESLPALLEMARWKSRGHALPSFVILGRIAGVDDVAIFKAWEDGKLGSVLNVFAKKQP